MKLTFAIVAALVLAPFSLCWANGTWEGDCWENSDTNLLVSELFDDGLLPEDWTTLDLNWESGEWQDDNFIQIVGDARGTDGWITTPALTFTFFEEDGVEEYRDDILDISFRYFLATSKNLRFGIEFGFSESRHSQPEYSQSATGDWDNEPQIQWIKLWETEENYSNNQMNELDWEFIQEKISRFSNRYFNEPPRIFVRFYFQSHNPFRIYLDKVKVKYVMVTEDCDSDGGGYGGGDYDDDDDGSDEDNDDEKDNMSTHDGNGDDDDSNCSVVPNNQSTHISLTALMLGIGIGAMFWRRR
jgi:hypothetical protein